MALFASSAHADPVPLGSADNFAVLASSTVTNTGPSVINGDVGVSPGSAITGFPPGTLTGTFQAGGRGASQAQTDLAIAYDSAAARTSDATIFGDLGGRRLTRGVYTSTGSLSLNGDLTLDAQGDPDAVFVFQAASTLLVGSTTPSQVRVVGGARARNVFWQVGSSATIGAGSAFAGSILARTSISLNTGANLNGRALAQHGAVTLDTNAVTRPAIADNTVDVPTPKSCTVGPTRRRPARPVLLSPDGGARVRAGNVRFQWRNAARASRYTLMVDHHKLNTGCATRAVMQIKRGRHTWRVIAAGQAGKRSSRTRAFSARSAIDTNPDEIRKGLGLDVLQKDVVAAAERVTLKAAEAAALRTALEALGKLASKASVVLIIVDAGVSADITNCDSRVLYRMAKPVFIAAGRALRLAAGAGLGPHRDAVAKIKNARIALFKLKAFIDGHTPAKECSAPYKVAAREIDALLPRLYDADVRLDEQEVLKGYFQKNRKTKARPQGFRTQAEARIGYRTCMEQRASRPDCRSIPTIFPGSDISEARDHDLYAIVQLGKPNLVRYAPPPNRRAPPRWYKDLPACKGKIGRRAGKDCDEYPYLSTRQGGPGASLRPINLSDNRREGNRLNALYTSCGVRRDEGNFLVVPLPKKPAIPTVIACNGRK